MPRTKPPYPAAFRQQVVDLVRAGRSPEELAREFEPSAPIRTCHERSHGTYGRPRIHADPAAAGWRVGGKRVARLLRAEGLRGVTRRKGPVTTVAGEERRPQPDLVERDFTAMTPDQLYVADITWPWRRASSRRSSASCSSAVASALRTRPGARLPVPGSLREATRSGRGHAKA